MAQPTLNLGGNLPLEEVLKQQQISRQQQMAQLLMQQGMQQPQGQMVSGRYVAPSIFQNLAGLANVYMGQRGIEKAEQEQLKMAERLREREGQSVKEYFQALEGTPAQPVPKGYELVDAGTPATGPNYQKALQIATNPYAPSWLKSQAVEMLKPQKLGEGDVLTRINPRTGQMETIASGGEKYRAPISVDTGAKIELRDPRDPTKILQVIPKSLSIADQINMQFEGKLGGYGSGMPNMGGQPNVSAQGGGQMGQVNVPTSSPDTKFAPATLPKYEYDSSMSPADNRAALVKFNEDLRKNVKNAKDSFGVLSSVADILSSNQPSSGFLQNVATTTGEAFGYGGKASQEDARLKILGERLTAQVPRFEGPQSDKDTASYRTAAGDVGNANKPISTRIAAVQTMIELNKKYYPNGDWDSIDMAGPVNRRYNPYLPTVAQDIGRAVIGEKSSYSPQEFRKTLNPQDQAAFDFVRKNPNHKDTPAIKKVLGIE
jgi:hypothetical protein